MSLSSSRIVISTHAGSILLPHMQYCATLESYEPGDAVGWGKTPQDAADDLYERLDRSIQITEALNPQSTWT